VATTIPSDLLPFTRHWSRAALVFARRVPELRYLCPELQTNVRAYAAQNRPETRARDACAGTERADDRLFLLQNRAVPFARPDVLWYERIRPRKVEVSTADQLGVWSSTLQPRRTAVRYPRLWEYAREAWRKIQDRRPEIAAERSKDASVADYAYRVDVITNARPKNSFSKIVLVNGRPVNVVRDAVCPLYTVGNVDQPGATTIGEGDADISIDDGGLFCRNCFLSESGLSEPYFIGTVFCWKDLRHLYGSIIMGGTTCRRFNFEGGGFNFIRLKSLVLHFTGRFHNFCPRILTLHKIFTVF